MKKHISILLFIIFPLTSYCQNELRVGIDGGYTEKSYVNANLSMSYGKLYCGISAQINAHSGVKGTRYEDNFYHSNDFGTQHETGKFYNSVGLDIGYYLFRHLCIGAGVGCAMRQRYTNFYDESCFLSGKKEWYHVSKKDGGELDAKGFINLFLYKGPAFGIYLRGQYAILSGAGVGIGIDFNCSNSK